CESGALGQKCGSGLDNNVGGTINCGCASPLVCSSSTAGTPGTCGCPGGTPYTCGPGAPYNGTTCGTLDNGCGSTLSCNICTGNANFLCSGGTCKCTPDTCRGRGGFQPDRCGGTLDCRS